jgi:hypothetical protein
MIKFLIKLGIWPRKYTPKKCRLRVTYQVCYSGPIGWIDVSTEYDNLGEILEYVPSKNDRIIRQYDPVNNEVINIYRWSRDCWIRM